ncbi:MAG: hypothetical protein LBQ54_02655 [Planctomycetaceae bacterium]|jgi:hypothetical protein|nr:hypothetical protein [Planctomycetaceae bacterium]
MLNREEYIEQAFFFRTFRERVEDGYSTQEILAVMKAEVLASTKLPVVIEFLLTDVKLSGELAPTMRRLGHYFTRFQTFIVKQAEEPSGKFDFRIALRILENEAEYRTSPEFTIQGLFFYQFEVLCRNRLGYEEGIAAICDDPSYGENWQNWFKILLSQLGIIDFADMIYVRSEYYRKKPSEEEIPTLFNEREGRIAHATRKRDPIYLFSALSRHLNYPEVPRQKRVSEEENLVPLLRQRLDLLESRMKLLEEELHGGININRFMVKKE